MKNKNKKTAQTSYFLICFGQFGSNSKVIRKIADNIMPAVSSQQVKYYNNDLNIIYHFKSDHPFNDLKEFVDGCVTDYVGMYMLITCNNFISLGMPSDIYDYLCELEKDDQPPSQWSLSPIDEQQDEFTKIESLIERIKEEEEMFMSEVDEIEQIRNKQKNEDVPSLDSILDTISTNGMGSLSKKEKELLEFYSSRQI